MKFLFDINVILPLEITIINGDYRVLNHGYTTRISYVVLKVFCRLYFMYRSIDKLTSIIDAIGDASYRVNSM